MKTTDQNVVVEFPLDRPLASYEQELLAGDLPTHVPGLCNVCGQDKGFTLKTANFREDLACTACWSFTRKRQITAAVLSELGAPHPAILRQCRHLLPEAIWLMETGAYAQEFATANLVTSDYLSADAVSGQIYKGVRHEDAMNPSFAAETLDLIISSDVMEHIPDPYLAHRQLYRCLKPGGAHIFTVPFFAHKACDEVRAAMSEGKEILLAPPEYHGDPLRGKILVFRIFGIEMLVNLESIGYAVKMLRVRDPELGILGSNGLVFVARRPL